MSDAPALPTEQELVGLPYFAILALGARSARYTEPLFRTWKRASEQHVRAVSGAIDAVEELAGRPDAETREPFWVAAADAALQAADAASAADHSSAPPEAMHAADSAAELADAIDPARPRLVAARAVRRAIASAARAAELTEGEQAFRARIGKDLERLRLHASVEGWTDETGVPMRVLEA